ncbi:MAG: polyprenyl diphosphate synthase [Bdellovibrionales bacterium]
MAIIMDGNGRWAEGRGHHRVYGHVRGATVAKKIIEECARRKIQNLTLFTFSTENWLRPSTEVSFLMGLLARRLKRETPMLVKNNIRFHCIGEIERLPRAVQERVADTIRQTAHCSGMNLTFALSYGGRQELTAAVRRLAQQAAQGEIKPHDIDEATLAASLESSFLPDPDLIVRTSGEHRLSNFFLWQAAYSEIHVCEKPWPEFDSVELDRSLQIFAGRERRFGRTSAQIANAPSPGAP